MKRYRMGNFVSQGFAGVFRHGLMSTASIFVLASTLLIMGTFAALILNIDYNLNSIDDFNEIVCYINLDADAETVENIGKQIATLDNIESIEFVSKEQALESEKQRYGDDYAHLFEGYGEDTNPLPDSYRISYSDVNKVDVLVYALENEIEGIDKTKNRLDIANKIDSVKKAVSVICTWLMVMLVVVSFFVISNTIRLAFQSRESEITTMRYIGATKFYITMPFIVEGLIIGIAASAIAFLVQWYAYSYLSHVITEAYSIINFIPFDNYANYFAMAFFVIGIVISVFGSAISARRYMKV